MKFSGKQKKRRKHLDPGTIIIVKQVLLGVFILSIFALIITAIWYATRIQSFTISNINIVESTTIDEAEVRNKIEQELEGAYFRLVPKRFSFWYPEERILSSVNEIERIKNVTIEKNSGTDITVTFDEYLPDALWCSNENDDVCFFLDETGFSFSQAPQLSGESVIRYYKLGEEPERGVSPFDTDDYQTTKEFTDLLKNGGWFAVRVEIDAVRDVFYTLAGGSEIKATLLDGATKPFEYLETIRQSKEFGHLESGNFQYVDLRFGSKVFVNEELKKIEVATSSEEVIGEIEEEIDPVVIEEDAETVVELDV